MVSVIIPNYNKEEYLSDCIESVLEQNVIKEIIIVDDQSTDQSWKVLSEYANKNNCIKLFRNPRKGAQSARNYGYTKSNGKYIQWLDSDDVLSIGKLKYQLNLLQSVDDRAVVFCNWRHFKYSIKDCQKDPYYIWNKEYLPIDFLIDLWTQGKMIANSSWLLPRKICDGILWDENLIKNQDGAYFFNVVLNATKIYYDHKTLVYYRKPNDNNISGNKDYLSWKSVLETYILYEKILRIRYDSMVKKAIAKNYLSLIIKTYPLYKPLRMLAFDRIKNLDISEYPKMGGKIFQFINTYFGFMTAVRFAFIYRLIRNI